MNSEANVIQNAASRVDFLYMRVRQPSEQTNFQAYFIFCEFYSKALNQTTASKKP